MRIVNERIYQPVNWYDDDPCIHYDEVCRAEAEEGDIITIAKKDGCQSLIAAAADGTIFEMKNVKILIRAEADEEGILYTEHRPKKKE